MAASKTNLKKEDFLAALLVTKGNIRRAAKLAEISEPTAHAYLKEAEFKSAFHEARLTMRFELVKEAIRRAKKGSDNLLMFTIKWLDREGFDDAYARMILQHKLGVEKPDEFRQPVTVVLQRGDEPARLANKGEGDR